MSGRIKWSLQATEDLQEIFSYWRRRNKSNRYGKKLNTEIKQVIKILYKYPYLGISTTDNLIRVKVFKTYKIFYQFDSEKFYGPPNMGYSSKSE